MKVKNYKKDFPILANQGKDFIYFDSAATSQKPKLVIEAEALWYTKYNANINRGVYKLSEQATELFESARSKTAKFLSAKSAKSIVFTKGATEGINLVAQAWANHNLKPGSVILLTEMEHHANIVPWQMLAKSKGLKLRYWPINSNGELIMDDLQTLFKGVGLLALTHVSNVLGTINPLKKIIKLAHKQNIKVLVDAAQSVPHISINVSSLDPDFLVFSAHKMLGPTGLGVLYIKQERHSEVRPYQFGGDMIREVKWQSSSFKPVPEGLEAGTPALAQVFSLTKSIDYMQYIGLDNIERHDRELVDYAYDQLSAIKEVTIYGPSPDKRSGLISFTVVDIHAHDLASLFDEAGVAIRAGHHCAMPLHKKLNIPATARISFQIYNTKSDIDRFIKILKSIIIKWQSSTNN